MTAKVLTGPRDTMQLPEESLGVIFFNELKTRDSTKIAIVETTDEEISYGEFFDLSVKVAKKLQSLGVKERDVIAIISQNNWKYAATIVGCFYIGSTVSELNHDYTPSELKHFLFICKPVVIFCTTKTLANLLPLQQHQFFPTHVITYDIPETSAAMKFEHFLDGTTNENFAPLQINPKHNVALILASSGTTGLPKCVQLTHWNIRSTLLCCHNPLFYDINESDSFVNYSPFFHIMGTVITLSSLLYDAKMTLMDKFVPDRFLQIIEKQKVTKLFVVPPILLFLVKHPLVEQYDLSSIKEIQVGAAPISSELEEMVQKKLKVTVREIYGMTEVSGAVTMIQKNDRRFGSSGKLIAGLSLKVCDQESGRILSAGQMGELRIKGDGIMKGYLGDEAQTVAAFDEEGYLKSGDLGYYDDDEYIYIVDRLKEIIKYKSFQVSPSELEALLSKHSAIKDVGVTGKPDERSGEVPVAFVVKQPEAVVTEEELLKYVADNISVQKHLYGGIRFVEEIPKSASGKILRRKLKELVQSA